MHFKVSFYASSSFSYLTKKWKWKHFTFLRDNKVILRLVPFRWSGFIFMADCDFYSWNDPANMRKTRSTNRRKARDDYTFNLTFHLVPACLRTIN